MSECRACVTCESALFLSPYTPHTLLVTSPCTRIVRHQQSHVDAPTLADHEHCVRPPHDAATARLGMHVIAREDTLDCNPMTPHDDEISIPRTTPHAVTCVHVMSHHTTRALTQPVLRITWQMESVAWFF